MCRIIRNQISSMNLIDSTIILKELYKSMTYLDCVYDSYFHDMLDSNWYYCDLFLILLYLNDNEHTEDMKGK